MVTCSVRDSANEVTLPSDSVVKRKPNTAVLLAESVVDDEAPEDAEEDEPVLELTVYVENEVNDVEPLVMTTAGNVSKMYSSAVRLTHEKLSRCH